MRGSTPEAAKRTLEAPVTRKHKDKDEDEAWWHMRRTHPLCLDNFVVTPARTRYNPSKCYLQFF